MGLDPLRQYRPGADPSALLQDLMTVVYPIRVAGEVHGEMTMSKVDGAWSARGFGGPGHARATVHLDHGPARLTITVCDDGQGGEASEGVPGHGITGMRERAHAVGGTLRVGPLPDRGFVVTASLPVPPRPEVATALDQVRA